MTRSRRPPKFAPFIGTGAILGFFAGSAVALLRDQVPGYGLGTAAAFLGVLGACVGALLAALVAVLLDRRG